MLTFFTTAKPFLGHSGIIQRNALQSWKLLDPSVEVILFGDEEGAAEIAAELGLRHEPHVERHESGMKYLNFMFARAQQIASYDLLCYSNCDIVFMGDFRKALEAALAWRKKFLLIGQRWDTDVTQPLDFSDHDWSRTLQEFAVNSGSLQIPQFIDYFLFPKGLYDAVPPLVVGRSYWDHWLVWKAFSRGVPVLDVTRAALVVHQNHGHGYHPQGKHGTNVDELALRNCALAGNGRHLRYTLHAPYAMDPRLRIHRVFFRRQYFEWKIANVIQFFVNTTFPVRRAFGLRRSSFRRFIGNDTKRP